MDANRTVFPVVASAALFLLGGACAKQTTKQLGGPANSNGQIHFKPAISAQLSSGAYAGSVCANFSLTPFSLDASGNPSVAGSPVTFESTDSATQTDTILGCIDPGSTGPNPNWGYFVTANGFNDCTGTAIPGLSPQTVTTEATVQCAAGIDTSLNITVNVSIAVADSAGYVDISAGVSASDVQIGCKQADGSETGGPLHFGESNFEAIGAPLPSAYTGIGISAPGAAQSATPAGTLQLNDGTVNSSTNVDEYVTGLLQLPNAPNLATIVQTFTPSVACGATQMTVEPLAPACITTAVKGQLATTQAVLVNLFTSWPGVGAVTAMISGTQITLYTSLSGPNLSSVNPNITGSDNLAQVQALSVSPNTALGIYADLINSGELYALVQTGSGPAVQSLTLDTLTGLWSAGAATALSGSLATQQAMGLFSQGGCFTEPPPACTPGPQAGACTATASDIPVPTPQGATTYPSAAGCSPTTYSPDFYFEFESTGPNDVSVPDSSGNGHTLNQYNGNVFHSITSDANGGYFHSYRDLSAFFTLSNPSTMTPTTHGATLETLLRFDTDGAIGSPGGELCCNPAYNTIQILSVGSDMAYPGGVDLRLDFYGVPSFAVDLDLVDASVDGSTTQSKVTSFDFAMTGFNGRSWESLLDGQFHHFAVVVDLDQNQISLVIDGKIEDGFTQALPTAAALTGLDHHQSLAPVSTGFLAYQFNNESFIGDLDEIAWTPVPLPLTLLAQHAAGATTQSHYDFTDACMTPPAVPPSSDLGIIPFDYAPTVDGTEPPVDPWTGTNGFLATGIEPGAVVNQLVSQQLTSFALPRYLAGNTMPRMDSWLDPGYYGWIPAWDEKNGMGTFINPGLRNSEITAGNSELAHNWNFHSYGTTGYSQDWDVAIEPGGSISCQTFGTSSTADLTNADDFYTDGAGTTMMTRAAATDLASEGATKWGTPLYNSFAARMTTLGLDPATQVVSDLLIVEDGETFSWPDYTYTWLSTSPDYPAFQAVETALGTPGACETDSSSADCTSALAAYQGATISLLRKAYLDGIASAFPAANFPSVRHSWYWLDDYPGYQAAAWALGDRDAAETTRGQLFQSSGTIEHLSSDDEYIRVPSQWAINAQASNEGIFWLDAARDGEEAAGDYLTLPFVSGGWEDDPSQGLRPSQLLSLLKYMVTAGAIGFHPGVFATSLAGPNNGAGLEAGRYPDSPGDAREYIWQAVVASYAQAVASHVEADMRASKIVWSTDATDGYHIWHPAGDPGNLVGVRQVFDASNTPLQRYLISAAFEGFDNTVGGQSRRSGEVTFQLTDSGPTVTLPARRQGSFYSLDLDGTNPVLIQYDAWHEDAAFNYWQHGFAFEAEAQDALQAGSGGAQLTAATEAPGLATLDFTNFTSFMTVQPASTQTWSLAQAAQAPRAGYQFEPRSSWGTTTWYVWVRARNHGSGAAPVYASVDQQAPMELGCISGSDWQWVQTNVISGQPAALNGVSMDQPHTLWVSPGSGTIDIDQVKLVAEPDHMECPLAATCGCGQ